MKRSIFFGILALIFLLYKAFFTCQVCQSANTLLPLIGTTYFSIFIAVIIMFPKWPSKHFKVAGLVWAIGLAITLTYLSPTWCTFCILAHLCHIAMWIFWKPRPAHKPLPLFIKLPLLTISLVLFPLLFYGLNKKNAPMAKVGTTLKAFAQNQHKGVILNFASPTCHYCKDQITTLNKTAETFHEMRVIIITPQLSPQMKALGPNVEWLEDPTNAIAPLFGIKALPTTVLLNPQGTILKTGVGAPINFEKAIRQIYNP